MANLEDTKDLGDLHTADAIAERIQGATSHSYLGDFVLGAVDGAVTTFAIVAGSAGAGFSNSVAVVLGLANVIADGFSMAAGNYLKTRADELVIDRFRRIEEMHIEQIPDGEREEVRQIFAAKGFTGELLNQVVDVITQDRKQWVDTMLKEEFGLRLETPNAVRAAVSTFVAFVLVGMVPILPLFFKEWLSADQIFGISVCLTAATFAVVGWANGVVNDRKPWLSMLETLLVGGTAASLAYVIGVVLKGLAE